MHKHLLLIALIMAGLPAASFAADAMDTGSKSAFSDDGSIGTATMKPDGTIVVTLRAEDDNGSMGDNQSTYPPTDKEYQHILEHIGSLKPGETKPVPPWPEIE